MSFKELAYKYYKANKAKDWGNMRDAFRKNFAKSLVDFDLAGESGGLYLAEDSRSYVYHVLSYKAATIVGQPRKNRNFRDYLMVYWFTQKNTLFETNQKTLTNSQKG